MSLEQQVANLVEASNNLTTVVNGKINEIDKKVDDAVSAVPDAIRDNFTQRQVFVDLVNGTDDGSSSRYRTIKAAIESVPDGGSVLVELTSAPEQKTYPFDDYVNIGSRKVIIKGGWSAMEADGYKAAILKPIAGKNTSLNRTYYKGFFSGEPGGRLYFMCCKVELPRIYETSSIEHGASGAFISGGLTVTTHNWNITGPHIYVEDGPDTQPMPFLRSSARDGKANLQDFTISYTDIETSKECAIFDLQYSTGTIRFAQYSSTVSDDGGASMLLQDLFSGISYGDHGYATNIVANAGMLKQVA
ncbi:hypothetical protein QYZ44_26995 [Vibrio parahaemolyticus]|nr:hypothetical protein [Vibrio parahaemolyticus]MDN4712363.1 hypothetical protein [Vibrio parahaemolyticus]